ncbi:hypothetical protein ACOSQ4_012373 [Xanthoceras sorbifolium]
MAASSRSIKATVSVDNAEAQAIFAGVQLACDIGIYPDVIESNCKRVVDLLNGAGSAHSELGLIISQIHNYPSRGNIVSFSFVPRATNAVVHAFARLALSLEDEDIHVSLHHILLADCPTSL